MPDMNYRLLCRLLSIVCLIIGVTMIFSLPWAWPSLGRRTAEEFQQFETYGFFGLIYSILLSISCWAILWSIGKNAKGELYRREAMAVVGLSWLIATLLGAMPYLLSGSAGKLSVRVFDTHEVRPQIYGTPVDYLSEDEFHLVKALIGARAKGLSESRLAELRTTKAPISLFNELREKSPWGEVLISPDEELDAPPDRKSNYRIRAVRMNLADALFESQSGFSTTGATVIAD